jgi:L-2-hydroxycarboxylate dehydrogenase (NAD+)
MASWCIPVAADGKPLPSKIGHFFGAIRVDAFRPIDEFKDDMDDLIRMIRNSPKADGQERIYIHGEKEFEIEAERRQHGIPLHAKVVANLKTIAEQLHIKW